MRAAPSVPALTSATTTGDLLLGFARGAVAALIKESLKNGCSFQQRLTYNQSAALVSN
jgi:hypothetical protein